MGLGQLGQNQLREGQPGKGGGPGEPGPGPGRSWLRGSSPDDNAESFKVGLLGKMPGGLWKP